MTGAPLVLHAGAAALGGRAVLVRGASGSGKSGLLLDLLAGGAQLVADDRTCLGRRGSEVIAWAPPAILGRIEARGLGILRAEVAPPTRIALVVDLDRAAAERLPARRCDILGRVLPLMEGARNPYICSAILQFLKGCMEEI